MTEPTKPDANEPRLLDHEYDGIREYDNPLPRWWVGIFWATIVYAVLYFLNVIPGLGTGKGWIANYEREMHAAQAQAAVEAAAHPQAEITEDMVFGFTHDAAALARRQEHVHAPRARRAIAPMAAATSGPTSPTSSGCTATGPRRSCTPSPAASRKRACRPGARR